jgi:hypothetical protein
VVHASAVVLKQLPLACPSQPTTQPWNVARQADRLPPIVPAHCSRQFLTPAPSADLHVSTHVAVAGNAPAKQLLAAALHPPMHDADLAAGAGQVVMQSARVAWQVARPVRKAVMHEARHWAPPVTHPCKQALSAMRDCIAQTPRARAQLFAHCSAATGA